MDLKRLESLLIKRLKVVGSVLCVLSGLFFGSLLIPETPEEQMTKEELFPDELPPLSPWLTGSALLAVSGLCFLIAWRRGRRG